MGKRSATLMSMALLLAALLLPLGCGSSTREDYFRELQEISERLAARLGELEVEAAEEGHPEEELKEALGGMMEEMASILEEGVLELSRVKVPRGGEGAHESLLELISRAAAGYRESAAALLPRGSQGEEHGAEGGNGEGSTQETEKGEEKSAGEPASEGGTGESRAPVSHEGEPEKAPGH